jgi:hypothetical protein
MAVREAKQRKWTKPGLKRLGSIHDVEGANLSSANQLINTCGTNGVGTCKS